MNSKPLTSMVNRGGRSRVAALRGGAVMLVGLIALGGASAQAQPILEVRIDNQIIDNNTTYEFEPTDLGTSIPLVVVLRNIGPGDLLFQNPPVNMSGGFPDQFELVQPPLETGNKLSPNGSTAFLVRFEPTIPKETLFTHIHVFTNDADSPFHMVLDGTVNLPKMAVLRDGQPVAPETLVNLPPTRVGDTSEVEFVIQNQGPIELELTGVPDAVEIFGGIGATVIEVIQQPDAVVPAFSSTTFRLAFTPTQARDYPAQLGISTNDLGQFPAGRFLANLRGLGLPPDCNGNDAADSSDIAAGVSDDCNTNGMPDECEDDADGDGLLDVCEKADEDDQPDLNDDAGDQDGADQDAGDQAGDDADLNDGQNVDDQTAGDNLGDGANDANDGDQAAADAVPGGLCGMGSGLPMMLSMLSLGGVAMRCRRAGVSRRRACQSL